MEKITTRLYKELLLVTPYKVSRSRNSIFIHINIFIKIEISFIRDNSWFLHTHFPLMRISKIIYLFQKARIENQIAKIRTIIEKDFQGEVSVLSLAS